MGAAIYVDPIMLSFEGASAELTGLFMYRDKPAGEDSLRAFLRDFDRGTADFDECTGSYRVQLFYPDGRTVAFSDNTGMLRWYFREDGLLSASERVFSPTLEDTMPRPERKPNFAGIAQYLRFDGIYGPGTVLRLVRRSACDSYYVAEDGHITERSKGLTPLEKLGGGRDTLERHMRRFAQAVSGEKVGCTLTGGFDSRLVLVHMIHSGLDPVLNTTGGRSHVDVVIAGQIAERLGRELLWFSDEPEGDGWIDEAIAGAGGENSVCINYRLIKRGRAMREKGVVLVCGGLGGECYKNRYIKGESFKGAPNWERFQSNLGQLGFPAEICGEGLAQEIEQARVAGLDWLRSHVGKSKASAYLDAGYEIMQVHGTKVDNMNAKFYIPYEPLLERNVAAAAFQIDPRELRLEAFHRDEIARLCPEIMDIKTDHKRTCNPAKKRREWFWDQYFILRSKLALALRPNKVRGRRDACFQAGLSSPQFYAALDRCKALGIIAPGVDGDALPAPIADRIFALGTML